MTYNEQMQNIIIDYQRSGEEWPASTRMIAAWAIRAGKWKPDTSSVINQCADRLGKAMREEYITDAQNRRVRAKHAARIGEFGEQQTLWADIRDAAPDHMRIAFQQRRRGIVGDCRQLKTDVDSYNDNNQFSDVIQLSLDFTYDVEEMALSAV
jgi:hypothetical protein